MGRNLYFQAGREVTPYLTAYDSVDGINIENVEKYLKYMQKDYE
jgi:hypothetical protein